MQSKFRKILIHGLIFVLVGLVWGLVVPHTPYPRLALTAHIQLVVNGMLFLLMALLLLTVPNTVGRKSIMVLLVSVYLTWFMALSEVANAWWGTKEMLPIAASQAAATGGLAWQEILLKITHASAGLGLIISLVLLIAGFATKPAVSRQD